MLPAVLPLLLPCIPLPKNDTTLHAAIHRSSSALLAQQRTWQPTSSRSTLSAAWYTPATLSFSSRPAPRARALKASPSPSRRCSAPPVMSAATFCEQQGGGGLLCTRQRAGGLTPQAVAERCSGLSQLQAQVQGGRFTAPVTNLRA